MAYDDPFYSRAGVPSHVVRECLDKMRREVEEMGNTLTSRVAAIKELRSLGASVVKIDSNGGLTVAFDGPMDVAAMPGIQGQKPNISAAEQERADLFASADDDD